MLRLAPALCLVTGLLVSVGCSSGGSPNRAKLRGTVTYKGQPVKAGIIYLVTEEGSTYQGPIMESGKYDMTDLPAGRVKVVIDTEAANPNRTIPTRGAAGKDAKQRGGDEQREINARMKASGQEVPAVPAQAAKGMAERYVKIPAKYAAAKDTPLAVELVDGQNTRDFELED
jgi:hypothetical protein